MALENISNVPQICPGTLRIALRALQFPNFLLRRGGPLPPPPLRIFHLDACIVSVALRVTSYHT